MSNHVYRLHTVVANVVINFEALEYKLLGCVSFQVEFLFSISYLSMLKSNVKVLTE